jgi:hypothetical protein
MSPGRIRNTVIVTVPLAKRDHPELGLLSTDHMTHLAVVQSSYRFCWCFHFGKHRLNHGWGEYTVISPSADQAKQRSPT